MSERVVSLRGILTRFGRNVVHEALELDIRRGEIVALVGGSGSGKTTLLRHIIGLTRPELGEVELFGEPLHAGSEAERLARRQRFGVLFQQGALFSAFTVFENIAFPLRELGMVSEAEIRDLVALKLAMVEMEPEHALLMPAELSGGMVKRAALARALALDPELLFLDEPTAGLDPIGAAAFDQLILTLRDALGLTVFLITHDLDTLYTICDRVAVLSQRRVLAIDTLDAVTQHPDPWIQDYFHGPRGRAAQSSAQRQGL